VPKRKNQEYHTTECGEAHWRRLHPRSLEYQRDHTIPVTTPKADREERNAKRGSEYERQRLMRAIFRQWSLEDLRWLLRQPEDYIVIPAAEEGRD
jgi:hypothetical protein